MIQSRLDDIFIHGALSDLTLTGVSFTSSKNIIFKIHLFHIKYSYRYLLTDNARLASIKMIMKLLFGLNKPKMCFNVTFDLYNITRKCEIFKVYPKFTCTLAQLTTLSMSSTQLKSNKYKSSCYNLIYPFFFNT